MMILPNSTNFFEIAAGKFVIKATHKYLIFQMRGSRVGWGSGGGGGGGGRGSSQFSRGRCFEMVKLCRTHWTSPPPTPPPPHTHTHRETFLDPFKILFLKSVTLGWTDGTCSTECDLQNCLCLRGVQAGCWMRGLNSAWMCYQVWRRNDIYMI